jgi:hypothetical protein
MGEYYTIETSVLIARLEPHSYNTTQRLQPTDFTIYGICYIRSDTNKDLKGVHSKSEDIFIGFNCLDFEYGAVALAKRIAELMPHLLQQCLPVFCQQC